MDGGFNRSRWQYHLRESLLFFWEPQFDEKTNEDLFQAFNFFYTPWPTLEDEELNRLVFNDVSFVCLFVCGFKWFVARSKGVVKVCLVFSAIEAPCSVISVH